MIGKIIVWLSQFDKSVLAFRHLADAPMDDPGLFHADGRSRLARVSRFPEPDREKLAILKRKADVVRIDARQFRSNVHKVNS